MRLSIRETAIQYVKKQTNTDVSESTVISVHTDRERGICRFLLLFTPLEESLSDSGVMRDYFCLGNIPQPLTDTIDEDQIYLCFDAYRSENWKTLID